MCRCDYNFFIDIILSCAEEVLSRSMEKTQMQTTRLRLADCVNDLISSSNVYLEYIIVVTLYNLLSR